jgi:hypothetical protein
MTSDRPKRAKTPCNIASLFRELQQLRKQVHEAQLELSLNRSRSADIDDKDRRSQDLSRPPRRKRAKVYRIIP